MDILTIIIIAIGLAMDCLAVSIAQGLQVMTVERPKPLLMAVLFGLFQGGMPLIGYSAGCIFADFFRVYAPWIALTLLAFIGGKMIWESRRSTKDGEQAAGWRISRLLLLAVATSIDALATGVIFIPVPERLWIGIGIIGLVSFLFSIGGYHIGKYMGRRFNVNVELIGGIILVLIGIKIWIEGCLL
ncbi:MAG: manganese efflux pump [Paludibacteraceae bacterium]|nr:manganese efflux pump [Paludibacteraceae bacterium]